jgi:hypothetical protein
MWAFKVGGGGIVHAFPSHNFEVGIQHTVWVHNFIGPVFFFKRKLTAAVI